ncbi:MAG TPA: hypothetical protein VGK31_04440 [Thermoanaerobaculia bacterium]|jgi:hypothetical protein
MMKKIYTALAFLLLATYAWAEFRGLDFPSGERETGGGVRGTRRSGFHGGK